MYEYKIEDAIKIIYNCFELIGEVIDIDDIAALLEGEQVKISLYKASLVKAINDIYYEQLTDKSYKELDLASVVIKTMQTFAERTGIDKTIYFKSSSKYNEQLIVEFVREIDFIENSEDVFEEAGSIFAKMHNEEYAREFSSAIGYLLANYVLIRDGFKPLVMDEEQICKFAIAWLSDVKLYDIGAIIASYYINEEI